MAGLRGSSIVQGPIPKWYSPGAIIGRKRCRCWCQMMKGCLSAHRAFPEDSPVDEDAGEVARAPRPALCATASSPSSATAPPYARVRMRVLALPLPLALALCPSFLRPYRSSSTSPPHAWARVIPPPLSSSRFRGITRSSRQRACTSSSSAAPLPTPWAPQGPARVRIAHLIQGPDRLSIPPVSAPRC